MIFILESSTLRRGSERGEEFTYGESVTDSMDSGLMADNKVMVGFYKRKMLAMAKSIFTRGTGTRALKKATVKLILSTVTNTKVSGKIIRLTGRGNTVGAKPATLTKVSS